MSFMTELQKRRDYHRTIRALRRMPLDTAEDLGIDKNDVSGIARRAVYGY